MTIDVLSLMVAIVINDAVLAIAIAVVARKRYGELQLWAMALALHALGYLLFVKRTELGITVSVVAGNAALAVAYTLFLVSIGQFLKKPIPWWILCLSPGAILIGFPLLLDSLALRVAITAALFGSICLISINWLFIHRDRAVGRGVFIMIGGFAILTVIFAVRMISAIAGQFEIPSLMVGHPVQALSFLASTACIVLLTVGMTLMTMERESAALAASQAQLSEQHRQLQLSAIELAEANRQLSQLSRTDPLTGLANRRALEEALANVRLRARRNGSLYSVLLCDVDHFKRYNDHFGHPAGDECLARVAQVLQAVTRRPGDLAARYGGEEFVILLVDTPGSAAYGIALELGQLIATLGLPHPDSEHGIVTLSVGVACSADGDEGGGHDLLTRADEALYRAKALGRNRAQYQSTHATH